jgi:cyclic pyranopterin monophosphate synthase
MMTEHERTSLTHIDPHGGVRMVDVGDKPVTVRYAVAEGRVRISQRLAEAIRTDAVAKGNVLETAKIAGIQAAKQTDRLIPLCHSLPLDAVHIDIWLADDFVHLRAEARTSWKTGVEMEALTAVSVAALTIIDMGKAVDPGMIIERVRLLEKNGGVHGRFVAHDSEGQS